MKLHAAVAEDAPALALVHAAAFETPWPAEAFTELLASPGVFALAAIEAAPVALVVMRAVAGEAEVLTLGVEPQWRRQGLASVLLRAGLGRAQALGAETAFLEVAADNPAAIALYRAAGFEAVGRRSAYYGRPGRPAVDALVLRRALNSLKP